MSDLKSISQYKLENWGPRPAERHLNELENALDLLAANPELGRSRDDIRKGYRRMEHGNHVVSYRIGRLSASRQKQQVEVVRILQQGMLPRGHFHTE